MQPILIKINTSIPSSLHSSTCTGEKSVRTSGLLCAGFAAREEAAAWTEQHLERKPLRWLQGKEVCPRCHRLLPSHASSVRSARCLPKQSALYSCQVVQSQRSRCTYCFYFNPSIHEPYVATKPENCRKLYFSRPQWQSPKTFCSRAPFTKFTNLKNGKDIQAKILASEEQRISWW